MTPSPTPLPGVSLGVGGIVVLVIVLVAVLALFTLIVLSEDLPHLIEMRLRGRANVPPRVSKLRALEFVAQHPSLTQLSDADAVSVAAILREVLDEAERRSRRFDLILAGVTLVLGTAIGAIVTRWMQ